MSLTTGGGQSWVVGKSPRVPMAESDGVQGKPSLGPPWHKVAPVQEPAPAPGQSASLLQGPVAFVPALQVWLHTGQTWMPGASGNRSPSRKISELSGRLRLEAPVEQSAVPLASVVTELMTQTLVAVLPGFGIGSGGPNRHPTLVQSRLLPVWAEVRLARVRLVPLHEDTLVSELPMSGTAYGSGTVLLPPPAKRPPHARFFDTLPFESCTAPQLPVPVLVVKFSLVGLMPQQGPPIVVVVVDPGVVVVVVASEMQSAATSPSAAASICGQVCVCTEQSAALVALVHLAVNLSVHFFCLAVWAVV